jgi:hypothetical protein
MGMVAWLRICMASATVLIDRRPWTRVWADTFILTCTQGCVRWDREWRFTTCKGDMLMMLRDLSAMIAAVQKPDDQAFATTSPVDFAELHLVFLDFPLRLKLLCGISQSRALQM